MDVPASPSFAFPTPAPRKPLRKEENGTGTSQILLSLLDSPGWQGVGLVSLSIASLILQACQTPFTVPLRPGDMVSPTHFLPEDHMEVRNLILIKGSS